MKHVSRQQASPFQILKSGHSRIRDVRRANIITIGKVSDSIKTTFGPGGMQKMLVSPKGDATIASDGLAIINNMATSSPITKLLIEAVRTQHELAGDGTKTVVILAGELLKKADPLLRMKIHPTTIMGGYNKARKRALETLESTGMRVSLKDRELLQSIASTAIGGRLSGKERELIASLAVESISEIAEERRGKAKVDQDWLVVRKKAGGSVAESRLLSALVVYKERPSPKMPSRLTGAKVALIGSSLDPLTYNNDQTLREYEVNTPSQLREIIKGELEFNRGVVKHALRAGAAVLFCQKRVSKAIMRQFADAGILALEMVSQEDMLRLEKVTGARIVTKVDSLAPEDLGAAGLAEFRKISGDEMLFIEGARRPNVATAILRGGTPQVVESLETIYRSAANAVAKAVEDGRALNGGGACEMNLSTDLRAYSKSFPGKEQLAIEAFADALEEIPKALASNSGKNPIDALTWLRAGHSAGSKDLCIEVGTDAAKAVDVFLVKRHAINAASDVATMVLGISDVIAVTNPAAVQAAQREAEAEQNRIQGERLRTAFKENEALKEVQTIDRQVAERLSRPESY